MLQRFCPHTALERSADVEAPSVGLAATLERFNFPLGRLTTGTPPRVDGRTINYNGLEEQPSDEVITPFSYLNLGKPVRNAERLVLCHMTRTGAAAHDVIRNHMHLLPKFLGNEGKGVGPRYASDPSHVQLAPHKLRLQLLPCYREESHSIPRQVQSSSLA